MGFDEKRVGCSITHSRAQTCNSFFKFTGTEKHYQTELRQIKKLQWVNTTGLWKNRHLNVTALYRLNNGKLLKPIVFPLTYPQSVPEGKQWQTERRGLNCCLADSVNFSRLQLSGLWMAIIAFFNLQKIKHKQRDCIDFSLPDFSKNDQLTCLLFSFFFLW